MKREFINKDKSIMVYTCDNLGEYFAEFTKYRKAVSESSDWEIGANKWYGERSQAFHEVDGTEHTYRKSSGIVEFLSNDYNNEFEGRNGRLELEMPVDLESPEWKSQHEKVNNTLKEIWKTGENKNPYGLDLNWPKSSKQNGSKKEREKQEIKKALTAPLKKNDSGEKAKEILNNHIGFQREKNKFENYVYLYAATKDGKFRPEKKIICYAGAPGTGKTTFVQTLKKAMGVPFELVSCSGLSESSGFSILGDENKPSLPAWVMKKNGCKNAIILFDEAEKAHDEQIQRDLVKLFKLYKNEEGRNKGETESKKLFDKYYQMDIELDHIFFFATVNYPQDLAPAFKKEMEMCRLEDYTDEQKEKILELKKTEIEKKLQAIYGEKREIIPKKIIKLLPKYIKEGGIRQSERVLYKIEREYIEAKEKGQEFNLGDPQKWLKKNVLAYQETFSPTWKHKWLLFPLWGLIWILSLVVIINKIILRKEKDG